MQQTRNGWNEITISRLLTVSLTHFLQTGVLTAYSLIFNRKRYEPHNISILPCYTRNPVTSYNWSHSTFTATLSVKWYWLSLCNLIVLPYVTKLFTVGNMTRVYYERFKDTIVESVHWKLVIVMLLPPDPCLQLWFL